MTKLRVTMTPPIRNEFDRARVCQTYADRLISLFGDAAKCQRAELDWQRHKPPIHHFNTFCTIARIEALIDFLPSERQTVSFIHKYE